MANSESPPAGYKKIKEGFIQPEDYFYSLIALGWCRVGLDLIGKNIKTSYLHIARKKDYFESSRRTIYKYLLILSNDEREQQTRHNLYVEEFEDVYNLKHDVSKLDKVSLHIYKLFRKNGKYVYDSSITNSVVHELPPTMMGKFNLKMMY